MVTLVVLLALTAEPATPPASRVGYDQALARVDSAPDVAQAAAAVGVRREAPAPGFFSSNPQLTAQPGFRSDDGQLGPEGQLTLQQSLSLSGLGAARREVLQREVELARLDHRLQRQERRLAVSLAWLTLWAAQEASRTAHDEELVSRDLVARLSRAAERGAGTRVELAAARALAAEAASLHLEWEGRRVEAGAALSALLGQRELAEAEGPLPSVEPSDVAGPATNLAVSRAREALSAEQARAEEVAAQWGPQLQLSLQGGREAPRQWFGNFGVGLTLPVFESGRRERSAHLAAATRLQGELAAEDARAEVRLKLARHEVEHAGETLALLETERLPASEEAAALEARRFAQGEATLFELSLLRRQALSARIATVVARARLVAARAALKELLGQTP